MTKDNPQYPYREWSYADRLEARRDPDQRENCRRYDDDSASSDRAYEEWQRGKEFSDPDPNGRFH
jgi:hypothetical protein